MATGKQINNVCCTVYASPMSERTYTSYLTGRAEKAQGASENGKELTNWAGQRTLLFCTSWSTVKKYKKCIKQNFTTNIPSFAK
jgi:hypothetical protein